MGTLTIRVDRTVPISALPISWRVTYSRDGRTEQSALAGSLGFDTQPAPYPIPVDPAAISAGAPGVATPQLLHEAEAGGLSEVPRPYRTK
jgi:hypothetical protein